MFLFYNYNFTFDLNKKKSIENSIKSSTIYWNIYILSFWSIVDGRSEDCRKSATKRKTLQFVFKVKVVSKDLKCLYFTVLTLHLIPIEKKL